MAEATPHTVRINRRAAQRLADGHPWVFASDVVDRGGSSPGEAVAVADPGGRILGAAHYSSSSQICLRLLSEKAEPINRAFFTRRLEEAYALRQRLVAGSDAFRLVHGEADRLPALVVDKYGDYLVVQTLDQGMDRAKEDIVACLQDLFSPRGIVARNDSAVRAKEELPLETAVLAGEVPAEVTVRMNGLTLAANLLRGQKTGVYLDQRENYLAAARYATGRALDCFTSGGGFALHAAPRCEWVEGVESSAEALRLAEANRKANGIGNVRFREADVFDLLAGYAAAERQFETIILDPPAFSKSRSTLEGASRGYKEINHRALRLLGRGGLLVSCSCSHHLSEAMLLEIIASASLDAGRPLRVLERRTQSQDHPILLTVPETHYLKCLILEVL